MYFILNKETKFDIFGTNLRQKYFMLIQTIIEARSELLVKLVFELLQVRAIDIRYFKEKKKFYF